MKAKNYIQNYIQRSEEERRETQIATRQKLLDLEEENIKSFEKEPERQFFYILERILAEIEFVEVCNKIDIPSSQNTATMDRRINKARAILDANQIQGGPKLLQRVNSIMMKQRDLDSGDFFGEGSKEEEQLQKIEEAILPHCRRLDS